MLKESEKLSEQFQIYSFVPVMYTLYILKEMKYLHCFYYLFFLSAFEISLDDFLNFCRQCSARERNCCMSCCAWGWHSTSILKTASEKPSATLQQKAERLRKPSQRQTLSPVFEDKVTASSNSTVLHVIFHTLLTLPLSDVHPVWDNNPENEILEWIIIVKYVDDWIFAYKCLSSWTCILWTGADDVYKPSLSL